MWANAISDSRSRSGALFDERAPNSFHVILINPPLEVRHDEVSRSSIVTPSWPEMVHFGGISVLVIIAAK